MPRVRAELGAADVVYLALDGQTHLLRWILAEPARLSAFQASIAGRIGLKKAAGLNIKRREDFEDLKESETLDICSNAGLFTSKNTKQILDIQLTKRNMAAHPSLVIIGAPRRKTRFPASCRMSYSS